MCRRLSDVRDYCIIIQSRYGITRIPPNKTIIAVCSLSLASWPCAIQDYYVVLSWKQLLVEQIVFSQMLYTLRVYKVHNRPSGRASTCIDHMWTIYHTEVRQKVMHIVKEVRGFSGLQIIKKNDETCQQTPCQPPRENIEAALMCHHI